MLRLKAAKQESWRLRCEEERAKRKKEKWRKEGARNVEIKICEKARAMMEVE